MQRAGVKGLIHIGVDFDEYPKVLFYMTLSLCVRDDETKKPYMHTVVLQFFTQEKEAVLIDPNEAMHNKDKSKRFNGKEEPKELF